jgi:hypothetical protein
MSPPGKSSRVGLEKTVRGRVVSNIDANTLKFQACLKQGCTKKKQ